MSHLDTSYKLGSLQAIDDFQARVADPTDAHPTAAPPKHAMVYDSDAAVKTAKKRMSKAVEAKDVRPRTISRTPQRGSSRGYSRLKQQMERKRRKA